MSHQIATIHNGARRSEKMNQYYCITAAAPTPWMGPLRRTSTKGPTEQQRKNNHTGAHVWKEIRQSKGWWWLWHIAMPPTVVPVRGQSTSNWASVTHALCQSSSSALACNVWHIAEPPTDLLSPSPADDGRGLRWLYRPRRRVLTVLWVEEGLVWVFRSCCISWLFWLN